MERPCLPDSVERQILGRLRGTLNLRLVCRRFAHECAPCATGPRDVEDLEWLWSQASSETDKIQVLAFAARRGDARFLHGHLPRCAPDAVARMDIVMKGAIHAGDLPCIRLLKVRGLRWTAFATAIAAKEGNIACLQWLVDHGCPWSETTVESAIRGGHMACLEWVLWRGCPFLWDWRAFEAAAARGDLRALTWAEEKGYLRGWRDLGACAVHACSHAGALRWVLERVSDLDSDEFRSMLVEAVKTPECFDIALAFARRHSLEIAYDSPQVVASAASASVASIQRALAAGFAMDKNATEHAALAGRLDCLRFLAAQGCEIAAEVTSLAAIHGHVDCIEFAVGQGCAWSPRTTCEAVIRPHFRFETLRRLIEMRCPWGPSTLRHIAGHGRLPVLRWAVENGCRVHDDALALGAAARGGHVRCVEYLREQGCPWSEGTARKAVLSGSLECLRGVCDRGCAPTLGAVRAAIETGRLDMLTYLIERGCPTGEEGLCRLAMRHAHLEVLQVLRARGCPWGLARLSDIDPANAATLRWARANGCPE